MVNFKVFKYNFIAWTLHNCLDISLLYIPLLSIPSFPPVTLLLNTINL